MRPGMLGTAAAVLGTALGLGWLLSRTTTQVVNWFVMTDELFYERLAISVAQTGSLLPRIHGEVISNVNQLYPVLISTVYGNGDVPAPRRRTPAERVRDGLGGDPRLPVSTPTAGRGRTRPPASGSCGAGAADPAATLPDDFVGVARSNRRSAGHDLLESRAVGGGDSAA